MSNIGILLRILLWAVMVAAAAQAAQPEQTVPPAAPKSITVVLDDNYPPYSFRDAEGQLHGILKDTWALWQQHTGICRQIAGDGLGRGTNRHGAGSGRCDRYDLQNHGASGPV
jgi:hypothetical protein